MTPFSRRRLLLTAASAWAEWTGKLVRGGMPTDRAAATARDAVEHSVFQAVAAGRGLTFGGWPEAAATAAETERLTLDMLVPPRRFAAALWRTLPDPALLGVVHEHLAVRRVAVGPDGQWRTLVDQERRKTAGVYYTPPEIVRYILGRTLDARWPARGRLLDPACGSGAFLLEACRRGRDSAGVDPVELAERIVGRDLDAGAVVAARRTLWLELAVGLPSRRQSSLAEAVVAAVVVGDFLAAPPEPAYDFVVGNPPYRRERGSLADGPPAKAARKYRRPRLDLAGYFVHLGLDALCPEGRLGMILPEYWTRASGAAGLVDALRTQQVDEVFALGRLPVFSGVAGRHLILVVQNAPPTRPTIVRQPNGQPPIARLLGDPRASQAIEVPADGLFSGGGLRLDGSGRPDPLDDLPTLESVADVRQGIAENPAVVNRELLRRYPSLHAEVGEGVFSLAPEEVQRLALDAAEAAVVRPYHAVADLARWRIAAPSRRLIFATPETWPVLEQFPRLAAHLARFKPALDARRETARGYRRWWHLHWPRESALWQCAKIVALQLARVPSFMPAAAEVCVSFSAHVVVPQGREHLNYVAALLNSGPWRRWFERHAKRRGAGLDITGGLLRRTPFRKIDFDLPAERAAHDRLVALGARMLALPADDDERGRIDAEIDRTVEELIGGTADRR